MFALPFATMTSFIAPLPQQTPSLSEAQVTLALQSDMARNLRALQLQSLRTQVFDAASLERLAAWSVNGLGAVNRLSPQPSSGADGPGGRIAVAQLLAEFGDETMVFKLSARRWSLGWRLDTRLAAVAWLQFHDQRDELSQIEADWIRSLCNAAMHAQRALSAQAAPPMRQMVMTTGADDTWWPNSDQPLPHSAPQVS